MGQARARENHWKRLRSKCEYFLVRSGGMGGNLTNVFVWLSGSELEYLQSRRGMELIERLLEEGAIPTEGDSSVSTSQLIVECARSYETPPVDPAAQPAHKRSDDERQTCKQKMTL